MPAATPGSWTDATCTATRCDGCPAACSTSSVARGEASAWCCHSAVWHTICVRSGPGHSWRAAGPVTQLPALLCALCVASRPASVLPPSTFRQTVVLLPTPRPTPVVSNTNALLCTSCSSALFSRRVLRCLRCLCRCLFRYVSQQVQQLQDLKERLHHDPLKLYEATQAHRLPSELRAMYLDLVRNSVAHTTINRWINMSISLKQSGR